VFRIAPTGRLTTLHSFNYRDGAIPLAALIQATDGNLYSTTGLGGSGNACSGGCGTVFQINQSGSFAVLYNFNLNDGEYPQGGLLQSTDGILYGSTGGGGIYGNGTLYRVAMGLRPFVTFIRMAGKVDETGPILGQGFAGAYSVALNGTLAKFTVISDTLIRATVPEGGSTGYVTVATPSGTLTSNVPFHVIK
jgi:uncharacterized repeat protein (TIGR03803 family)